MIVSFSVSSQSLKNSDSLTIAKHDLEKVYRSAQRGKLYKEEVDSKNKQIDILFNRIATKDTAINILKEQVKTEKDISKSFSLSYELEKSSRQDLQTEFDYYKKTTSKTIKKLKVQKTTKTVGGVVVGVAVGVLVGSFLN